MPRRFLVDVAVAVAVAFPLPLAVGLRVVVDLLEDLELAFDLVIDLLDSLESSPSLSKEVDFWKKKIAQIL